MRSPSKISGVLFGLIILIIGLFSNSVKMIGAGIFWIILAYLIGED